ncbi:PPK2 family polyphosphate kinase [Flavobacterium sp. I3-2]|uniref:PPK2 family polyphosphate kinase n=1 Tax=Flavobacterium sp. I3-2 TaxID=2748319 RepID=UPI0015A80B13|nr:PPK2 family polyphosphate kinase [Flavobacterium sp. I3-2]
MKTDEFKAIDNFDLNNYITSYKDIISIEKAEKKLKKNRNKLSVIQDRMYAYNKYSLLICIQGMDASGKDSLIREVFKNLNAQGIEVTSFKAPSEIEYQHDYLWRHYIALPSKGKIGVFNRSHYENVLISQVHPEIVLKENIPNINKLEDITDEFWEMRYNQINQFEEHLVKNGTIVLKFFLNMDKEEQKERLLRRIDKTKHNWKFSASDVEERERWDDYMKFYDKTISRTSTDYAPWYIIPSNEKEISRCLVSEILVNEMKKYKDIQYPKVEVEETMGLKSYKTELLNE